MNVKLVKCAESCEKLVFLHALRIEVRLARIRPGVSVANMQIASLSMIGWTKNQNQFKHS